MSDRQESSHDWYRQVGKLEARMDALENELQRLDARLGDIGVMLTEIHGLVARVRGGWAALSVLGSLVAGVAGLAGWIIAQLNGSGQ